MIFFLCLHQCQICEIFLLLYFRSKLFTQFTFALTVFNPLITASIFSCLLFSRGGSLILAHQPNRLPTSPIDVTKVPLIIAQHQQHQTLKNTQNLSIVQRFADSFGGARSTWLGSALHFFSLFFPFRAFQRFLYICDGCFIFIQNSIFPVTVFSHATLPFYFLLLLNFDLFFALFCLYTSDFEPARHHRK